MTRTYGAGSSGSMQQTRPHSRRHTGGGGAKLNLVDMAEKERQRALSNQKRLKMPTMRELQEQQDIKDHHQEEEPEEEEGERERERKDAETGRDQQREWRDEGTGGDAMPCVSLPSPLPPRVSPFRSLRSLRLSSCRPSPSGCFPLELVEWKRAADERKRQWDRAMGEESPHGVQWTRILVDVDWPNVNRFSLVCLVERMESPEIPRMSLAMKPQFQIQQEFDAVLAILAGFQKTNDDLFHSTWMRRERQHITLWDQERYKRALTDPQIRLVYPPHDQYPFKEDPLKAHRLPLRLGLFHAALLDSSGSLPKRLSSLDPQGNLIESKIRLGSLEDEEELEMKILQMLQQRGQQSNKAPINQSGTAPPPRPTGPPPNPFAKKPQQTQQNDLNGAPPAVQFPSRYPPNVPAGNQMVVIPPRSPSQPYQNSPPSSSKARPSFGSLSITDYFDFKSHKADQRTPNGEGKETMEHSSAFPNVVGLLDSSSAPSHMTSTMQQLASAFARKSNDVINPQIAAEWNR